MACDKVLPTAVQFMVKKTHTHTQNPAENSTEWLENLIKLLATMSFCIKYCLLHLFSTWRLFKDNTISSCFYYRAYFKSARSSTTRSIETTTRWNHRRVCEVDFTLHSLQLLLPPLTFELEINQCVKFLGRFQNKMCWTKRICCAHGSFLSFFVLFSI